MSFDEEKFAKKITDALNSKEVDDRIAKKLEIARNNALLAYSNKNKEVLKGSNTLTLSQNIFSEVVLKVVLPIMFLIAVIMANISMNHQFSLDTSVVDVSQVFGLDEDENDELVDFGLESVFE